MAILQDNPTMYRCPKCNSAGPLNFRLEQRVTLKKPDPDYPDVFNVQSTETVYACAKCGNIVQRVP